MRLDFGGMLGTHPLYLDLVADCIAVVALVTMHHQVCWQSLKQSCCRCAIGHLPTGEHQAQGTAQIISEGMDLGCTSTA